ncbi:MAG: hypothetical protein II355_00925 [Bacteroidales bacterium]|nr:hypothetical protein [Bacteroidales bacterium]MBQ2018776.1 hypothetical protein [Alistipes sp.]
MNTKIYYTSEQITQAEEKIENLLKDFADAKTSEERVMIYLERKALQEQMYKMKAMRLPEVGEKVTEYLWSDRNAYTIVKVLSNDKVVIAENKIADEAKVYEDYTEYVLPEVHEGTEITISRRKNGMWYKVGAPTASGEVRYALGYWYAYYDPCF